MVVWALVPVSKKCGQNLVLYSREILQKYYV